MSVVATNGDDVLTLAVDGGLVSVYERALEAMALSARAASKSCDRGDARTRFVEKFDRVGDLRGQLTRRAPDGSASLTGPRVLLREAAFLAATSATEQLDVAVEATGSSEESTVGLVGSEAQQRRLLKLNDASFAAVGMLAALQQPPSAGAA